MQTVTQIFVILLVRQICLGLAFNPLELLGGADLLKEHLVRDLGMQHEPNMKKVNKKLYFYKSYSKQIFLSG